MISVKVYDRQLIATAKWPITSGSVGLPVSFEFSPEWDGLAKTAVFTDGETKIDVALVEDACTVPAEVLANDGETLFLGVHGSNAGGTIVIPTIWGAVGHIVPGAAPSGFDPDPPTPSWAAQVQEIAQDALNTANGVREDADAGAFDGATYTPAVSAGGDLSWTNDKGKPNPPTVNIKGPEGQPGQTGATPDISIGTVETLPPGSPATATITGTAENPVLSFGIPQGQQGAPGEVTQAEFDELAGEVADQKSAIESLDALVDRKAGMLVDTASGAIASFVPDTTIDNLLGVNVAVEPVQAGSGDPSPDNVRPISGWDAVGISNAINANIWDEQWLNGYLGNSGAYISDASSICAKNYILVHPGQTMYVVVPSGTSARICAYAVDGTYLERINSSNSVYTVPDNAYKIRFSIYGYGTTYNNDVSINYPATDHAYHPYTGNTYTITIGQTVYGGTLDVTGGKMYARPFFPSYNGQTLIGPWISSMDVYAEGTTPTIGAEVVDMGGTPTVYDIDPVQIATIAGQTNNVWADAGDVTVEYAADLKAYIDRLNQPTEDDMIANSLIASGKYFTVNNRLFLSTASIAVGAQIIPGTNCTETSLVEALNALNA